MATHTSTLAWKIPWTEEPSRLQSMGIQRVAHDWATSTNFFSRIPNLRRCKVSLFISSRIVVSFKSQRPLGFQSCSHCWVFQICWHIECSTFTASSWRIWNSSTGIPSPPLALFIVMLPKAQLTHMLGCLALGDWSHHCCYLGHEDLFCTVLLCILATFS